MSAANEDLIDYEEDEVVAVAPVVEAADPVKVPGVFGVHSTGFRDFLLKPELLRAISDLGFEHPSEGARLAFFRAPSDGAQCSRSASPRPSLAWTCSARPSPEWVRSPRPRRPLTPSR